MLMCHQCDCQFVSDHIVPVAIKLVYDRVAHVRNTATNFVSTCIINKNALFVMVYTTTHVCIVALIGRIFALYSWK